MPDMAGGPEPYTAAVVEYFRQPVESCPSPAVARAGTPQKGAVIELHAALADGLLRDVGFRVWGCPHIIAGCNRLTELLEGKAAEQLIELDLEQALAEFDIPVEKAGKILILKDTMREAYDRLRA